MLLVLGSIAAAPLTRLMRQFVPFPTYTTPFIVLTWVICFLGLAVGAPQVAAGDPLGPVGFVGTVGHGVSQVMFQASVWTGLLFVVGIGLSDWRHATWVLVGLVRGDADGELSCHRGRAPSTRSGSSIALFENVELGLYGYNATLAAVALYLWRRSADPTVAGDLALGADRRTLLQTRPSRLTAPSSWRPGWCWRSAGLTADSSVSRPHHRLDHGRGRRTVRDWFRRSHEPIDSWSLAHASVAQERDKLMIFTAAQVAGSPQGPAASS